MEFGTLLYLLDVMLNTLIILLDIFIIFVILNAPELRHNPVIMLTVFAMSLDILVYVNVIAHDVPSYFLNKDVTTPLFSSCCGYTYLTKGHYWYFDFAKPYTYLYSRINIILQVVCLSVVIPADVLIIYKLYKLQRSEVWVKMSTTSANEKQESVVKKALRMNREAHLALNFFIMTLCFLLQTLCFNVVGGNGVWKDLVMKIASKVNLSKWAIYLLRNNTVRQKLLEITGLRSGSAIAPHSLATRTGR
ncbi:hypothetical protein Y032_0195g1461 [Ancylostoma ceylanicum]|uniref:G-protein coupled receptors family 1 profile domain-containing protein n=1 Tax=Ancylostoma ceylanicum TaxID=53326 RepID=A0A016SNU3_9BILA|nr:hypothetical protein Y032_0195g1461 [Ancylostoma ceylanicum]